MEVLTCEDCHFCIFFQKKKIFWNANALHFVGLNTMFLMHSRTVGGATRNTTTWQQGVFVCKYVRGIKVERGDALTCRICALWVMRQRERKRWYAGGMSAPLPSCFEHSSPRFSCQTLYSTLSSAKAEVLQRQNTDMRYMRRVDTRKKFSKTNLWHHFLRQTASLKKKQKNPKTSRPGERKVGRGAYLVNTHSRNVKDNGGTQC